MISPLGETTKNVLTGVMVLAAISPFVAYGILHLPQYKSDLASLNDWIFDHKTELLASFWSAAGVGALSLLGISIYDSYKASQERAAAEARKNSSTPPLQVPEKKDTQMGYNWVLVQPDDFDDVDDFDGKRRGIKTALSEDEDDDLNQGEEKPVLQEHDFDLLQGDPEEDSLAAYATFIATEYRLDSSGNVILDEVDLD